MNHRIATSSFVNSPESGLIEWLRFFCVVCVVYLHAGLPFDGQDLISCHHGLYDTLRIVISHGFCRIAVPTFFIISGYLFFKGLERWDFKVWGQKLKRRIKTLVVPYVLWIVLSVLFYWLLSKLRLTDTSGPYFSLGAFWDTGTGLPHNYPLWFVRNLIVLNVLAPVIAFYIQRTRVPGLAVLFLLYFFNIWLQLPGFEATGFFFYSLGAFLSLSKLSLADICKKYRWLTASISIPLLILMVLSYGNHPALWEHTHRLFTLTGSVALIGCAAGLYEEHRIRYNRFLSSSTFFIYAAHGTIALPIIQSCLRKLWPSTQSFALIFKYITAPVFTVLLLFLCYRIGTLLSPKAFRILSGNRTGLAVVSDKAQLFTDQIPRT